MSDNNVERVLLPTNVKPSHYEIYLKPNFDTCKFDGNVSVNVQVNEATNTVTLHAYEVTIDKDTVFFEPEAGDKVQGSQVSYDDTLQTATLTFPQALPVGKGVLRMEFQGILNDDMAGFYRSKQTVDGKEHWLATTQFEPTDARRAFPCWDEPALKATFGITITSPSHMTTLCNTNVEKQEENKDDDTITYTFAKTPIMSTYLVAFVVGQFDYVESTTSHGIRMRVYTQPGIKEQGTFALEVGTKVLSYFTDYFAVDYPLPKQDMIAIPDFSAGAMENWGLVTYRETALLADPEKSGISTRQRVAYVVGHELAHQWFGNLVTMEWWRELWLNEGFATYIGNQVVDVLFPDWDIWTQFVSHYSASARRLDSLATSHPIEVDVADAAQINEIFDQISYAKGASVIRMIADFIGPEAFQKGLQAYLDEHKYGNTVTEDLWKAWATSSGQPIAEFMDNWTKKMGYPVMTVTEVGGADGDTIGTNEFKVTQERFYSSPTENGDDTLWWVWLTYDANNSDKSNQEATSKRGVLVKEASETVQLDANIKDASWIVFNRSGAGFYRVQYSTRMYERLTEAIKNKQLAAVDRLNIQNDVFALAKSGRLSTVQALRLAHAYAKVEDQYPVWSDLLSNVGDVANVWADEPVYTKLRQFIGDLARPMFEQVGWDAKEGEGDLTQLLRVVLISALGKARDEAVLAEARKRFEKHHAGEEVLPADLRLSVYAMVAVSGTEKDYEAILDLYRKADSQEERVRALRGLGYTSNEDLIRRTLDFTLSDEVRPQDTFYGVASTVAHPLGRRITWAYFKENFGKYQERFGNGFLLFARIISFATKHFTTEEKAAEIEAFFQEHPVSAAERTIQQSLENVRANAKWLNNNRDEVAAYLNELF